MKFARMLSFTKTSFDQRDHEIGTKPQSGAPDKRYKQPICYQIGRLLQLVTKHWVLVLTLAAPSQRHAVLAQPWHAHMRLKDLMTASKPQDKLVLRQPITQPK